MKEKQKQHQYLHICTLEVVAWLNLLFNIKPSDIFL